MKKIISLVLVALMVLALNVAVVAANTNSSKTVTATNAGSDGSNPKNQASIPVYANLTISTSSDYDTAVYSVSISWEFKGEDGLNNLILDKKYTWNPASHTYSIPAFSDDQNNTIKATTSDLTINVENHSNRAVKIALGFTATNTSLISTTVKATGNGITEYSDIATEINEQSLATICTADDGNNILKYDDENLKREYNFEFDITAVSDTFNHLQETKDTAIGTVTVTISAAS